MMLPLLLCLPALLGAQLTKHHFTVEEGPNSYIQTVTFDFHNQVQIIEVPAHNNIVHSRNIFYFNEVRSGRNKTY